VPVCRVGHYRQGVGVGVRSGQRRQVSVRLEDVRLKLALEYASLKLKQAELDLEKAHKPAELAAAEKAVRAAQVVLTNVSGGRSTAIEQAQSSLRSAKLAIENAERERQKLMDYKRGL